MKEFIIPVNVEAHSRALVAIVGEESAQLILKAYKAIDSAMVFGYERGHKDGSEEVNVASEALQALSRNEGYAEGQRQYAEDSWEAGYSKGLSDGYTEADDSCAYDDGYCHGVSDARLCPADADREVARLCGEDDIREDISLIHEDDIGGGLYQRYSGCPCGYPLCTYHDEEPPAYQGDSGDETDGGWYAEMEAYERDTSEDK